MSSVLEQPELVVAPDERGLGQVGAAAPAALGHDAQRPPGGHRRGLALEHLLAGRLEGDGRAGRAHRRLADEHRAGGGDRLQPGGGVDEVAGDQALAGRARG